MALERAGPRLTRLVEERAGGRCEYCHTPGAYSALRSAVEHIVPVSRGGLTFEGNLAWACGCHRYKSDQTTAPDPLTRRLVRLFDPRRQVWKRHFRWSDDGAFLFGRTATGRATVDLLRMNRPPLVNLRRLLALAGRHPPADE